MSASIVEPDVVLEFWFVELESKQHFRKTARVDDWIHERFQATHAAAARGELSVWRETPAGRLAEIVVMDQFSRNLYREDPRAFACDGMALVLAQEALRAGAEQHLSVEQKPFLYMPFMHSESVRIHETALRLFSQPGLEYSLKYEREHKAIIDRFGRYPHRNAVLDRPSTEAEKVYLAKADRGF